ncbi:MAG: hypothetical protein WC919_00035 [Candidatus Paceibacterota bacterium]|jgi:hypothetical protein
MPRFYQWDEYANSDIAEGFSTIALQKGPRGSDPFVVEYALLLLEDAVARGLPDFYQQEVYKNENAFRIFLPGFFFILGSPPDRRSCRIRLLRLISDSPRFSPVVDAVQRDWGVDLRAEFEASA